MRWPADLPGPGGRIRFPPDRGERNPAVRLYTSEEMEAIVAEANMAGLPVAAHAGEAGTALMAVRAGVTSVEHVFEDGEGVMGEVVEEMRKRGTVWVPTLAAAEMYFDEGKIGRCKERVKRAFDGGVVIAAGGDTGTFNHGLNVREMEIMMEAGIPVEEVLVAGTYHGWLACGKDACGFRFGWWEEGNRADIIALDTDPREDPKALRKVSFVMKDGQVWKRDGLPVGMIAATQWPEEAQQQPSTEASVGGESSPESTMLSTGSNCRGRLFRALMDSTGNPTDSTDARSQRELEQLRRLNSIVWGSS
ncbi:hypothetical protein VTI74DRAFT_1018 [Chaetomium olivicolor]